MPKCCCAAARSSCASAARCTAGSRASCMRTIAPTSSRRSSTSPASLPRGSRPRLTAAARSTAALCPEHRQRTCLALLEVNTACNLDCPVCFANAGAGFNLSLAEVESMLGPVRGAGGAPGGGPVLGRRADHPSGPDRDDRCGPGARHRLHDGQHERIAGRRGRSLVRGVRRSTAAHLLQFDGLSDDTYRTIRGDARSAHDPRSGRHPDVHPAGRPATNGAVERVQRTILEECWRPAFARSLVPKLTGLTRDLAGYLRFYNEERAHTGRLTAGRTPLEALIGARKMRPR